MSPRFQQKLTIPFLAGPLVKRSELYARIEQAITTRRLVVLAAPAGWGKTTVLVQWAAISKLPVAWYTLDSGDHDPQVFLDYLLHTVAPFVPGAADLATQLSSAAPEDLGTIARATALAVAEAPAPFTLVLDDLHLITDETDLPGTTLVIGLLASLIEYATNCHLVLASRTLPDLRGLVRLIASRRATVLDYSALQFSTSEVQELADVTNGEELSTEGAEQIAAQLGGWVTGIVLSLDQAIQSRAGPLSDGRTNTTQVFAYFAEQVIAPLPDQLQRFLEDTSVLEDLSPQRCDALRDTNDSTIFLDAITKQNLFVSQRAEWLVYHALFRDFLRTRLARDPQRERGLLLRAGALYGEEDDLERAIICYLAAGNDAEAIALLRSSVPRFRQRSLHTTLLACFDRLGQDRMLPADLLLAQARVFRDLALWDRAQAAVQLAETIGNPSERWDAQILAASLSITLDDQKQAQKIIDTVPYDKLPPRLQVDYHIVVSRIQRASNDHVRSIASLKQAQALAATFEEDDDRPVDRASIYDMLGLAYALGEQRDEALRHLKLADALWRSAGNIGRRASTLNNLGMLAMEDRNYAEARSAFKSGLEIARQTSRARAETTLLWSLSELELIEGNIGAAADALSAAFTLSTRLRISGKLALIAVGAQWVAALQGNIAQAKRWQHTLTQLKAELPPEVQSRAALANSLIELAQPQPNFAYLKALADQASVAEELLVQGDRAYLMLLRATLALASDGWKAAAPQWALFEQWAAGLPQSLLLHMLSAHSDLLIAASAASPLAQQLANLIEQRAQFMQLIDDLPEYHSSVQPSDPEAKPPVPEIDAPSSTATPTSATRWHVTALGVFSCSFDGTSCNLPPGHQALLVRLLDAGPAGISVERLWEAVWGDTFVSMSALHQALRRLRNQTGLAASAKDNACAIRSEWDTIDYDVHHFERVLAGATNKQSLERAVALYGGEFLPSAPLSAAVWADARRDHLQQRYLDALEQLAELEAVNSPQRAIRYYQQVLQIDGCREQTATQLMRLAANIGNRSLVNTTFEHLRVALRSIDAAPTSATTMLHRQLV